MKTTATPLKTEIKTTEAGRWEMKPLDAEIARMEREHFFQTNIWLEKELADEQEKVERMGRFIQKNGLWADFSGESLAHRIGERLEISIIIIVAWVIGIMVGYAWALHHMAGSGRLPLP